MGKVKVKVLLYTVLVGGGWILGSTRTVVEQVGRLRACIRAVAVVKTRNIGNNKTQIYLRKHSEESNESLERETIRKLFGCQRTGIPVTKDVAREKQEKGWDWRKRRWR